MQVCKSCCEQTQQHPLSTKRPSATYRAVLAQHGFLIKDSLGAGSYSKVKHAVYTKSPRVSSHCNYPHEVAIKIIDRSIAPKDFQERFLPRELNFWPNLSHPNIVKMLQCFSEENRVYMILEFVERGDALRFIQTNGAVSESTGKIWVYQVSELLTREVKSP